MFQYYINKILIKYLDNFCIAYLNNILIYLENPLKHKEHVCKVLLQLCKAGLQANIKKYKFNVTYTKYLSFVISTNSIEVNLEKVKAIYNQKYLTTIKGIQSFLKFCNFYQCFIPNYKHIIASLTQLTYKDHAF